MLRVTYKGGEGSGNFRHAGRPGEVGGSSAKWSFSATNPFRGAKAYPISDEDRSTISKAMNSVFKVVPSLGNVQVAVGMGPTLATWTTHKKTGDVFIIIDTHILDSTIKRESSERLKEWFVTDKADHASILEHVAAHECGHLWGKDHKDIMANWDKLMTDHPNLMTEYGWTVSQPGESFADHFARFATGLSQPPALEDWFLENVK